jgi:hypothetical protein
MENNIKNYGIKLVIVLIGLVTSVLLAGTVVYYFYDWFLKSWLTELPAITFPQAVGISIVLSLFRNRNTKKLGIKIKKCTYSELVNFMMRKRINLQLLTLGIGWLIHMIFLK